MWFRFICHNRQNHGRIFHKFKPLNIWIKMIFIELLLQRKFSFIRVYTQVKLAGFLGARPKIFQLFRQVWSWVSSEALCDISISFSVWFFIMQFNPWPDFHWIYNHWNWIILYIAAPENLEAKYADSRLFWTNMACRGGRPVKTIQILVEFF